MSNSTSDRAKTLYIKRCHPGEGPLVVFLHAVGISSWMWESVVKRLPGIDALLVDLPGHGRSCSTTWQSLDETAQVVHEAIETRHEASEVHVVGVSLGAYVGLNLLRDHPTRYRTALLSGMHIGGMPRAVLMTLMMWAVSPLATRPMFARKTALMMGVPESDIETFVREAGMTAASSFRQAGIDVVKYSAPDSLSSIQTDTVFAAGSQELPLILSSLDSFCKRVPNARSLIVPDAGHGWPIEKPRCFAETVRTLVLGKAANAGLADAPPSGVSHAL